jgi:hypothetical protein
MKRLCVAAALAGLTVAALPASAVELIVNGGFEADGADIYHPDAITGWTALSRGVIGGAGVLSGTLSPGGYDTVGASSGTYYGFLDAAFPSSNALLTSFTSVPVLSATLSFKLFANDQSANGTVYIDETGLDHETGGAYRPNQHVRVDLLAGGADPFDTGTGVLRTFYLGGGTGRGFDADPNPYVAYTFDLTGVLASGGTYQLRFANVANQGALQVGVDDVSLTITPVPEPSAYLLLGAGLGVLALSRGARGRRRIRSQA